MSRIKFKKFILTQWELLTLLIGNFISFDSLKYIDSSSLSSLAYTPSKVYIEKLIDFRTDISLLFTLRGWVIVILAICIIAKVIKGKAQRQALDLIGGILMFSFTYQFISANLLLFNRLKTNDELLLEVVYLFFSSIIVFAWVYWRVDSSGQEGINKHINFKHKVTIFEYFYLSSIGLHSRIALISSAETVKMKLITYIHALCLFDMFGLLFSHSVAIALR